MHKSHEQSRMKKKTKNKARHVVRLPEAGTYSRAMENTHTIFQHPSSSKKSNMSTRKEGHYKVSPYKKLRNKKPLYACHDNHSTLHFSTGSGSHW